MTQEEVYIRLLKGDSTFLEGIPKEFFRDFQFCKVALESVKIDYFLKKQQMEMNYQAVEAYLNALRHIGLSSEAANIFSSLPSGVLGSLTLITNQLEGLSNLKSVAGNFYLRSHKNGELSQLEFVGGDLSLWDSRIVGLPRLKTVKGDCLLQTTQIEELPKLQEVGGDLNLAHSRNKDIPRLRLIGGNLFASFCQVTKLPKLESVGENLYLCNSQIKELPQLTSVGGQIYTRYRDIDYWKSYFLQSNRAHLEEKLTRP
jgi:hypothetical protein